MVRCVALYYRLLASDFLARCSCYHYLAVLSGGSTISHRVVIMKGYLANIENLSLKNKYFRQVLYTDPRLQLVVMSLRPKEDIGEEVHQLDQFIRVEKGTGKAVLNGKSQAIRDGSAVIVPKGARHNIINTSSTMPMKLYTVYAPPNHKPGTIHRTKTDAEKDESDHFDGQTIE
jgi:mannose-6-phosphate isomerase-like protein (cupin superfamily)